ncbi:MAG: hypothetical protein ACE5ID_09610, partial [Acidobacteriota bacterium]
MVLTPHFHAGHPVYERRHQILRIRRADAVAVISPHEREILTQRGVNPSRITVVGCGLPEEPPAQPVDRIAARRALRERLGLAPDTDLLICVAQKTAHKGLEDLVEAVRTLIQEGRDVALVLAGPATAWFRRFYAGLEGPLAARVFD